MESSQTNVDELSSQRKKQQRRERYTALSPNKNEESRAKKREYQHSRLSHLKDEAGASKLEQARAKNREYQRSHLARLKAEADASKLEESLDQKS